MKKFWKFLDGKKSAISATVNALLIWVVIQGWVDENTAIMLAAVSSAWTGVAIAHKGAKGELTK